MSEEKEAESQPVPENTMEDQEDSESTQRSNEALTEELDSEKINVEPSLVEDSEDIKVQIVNLEEKIKGLEEALLRARADSDNARKRAVKDVQAAHKFGSEKFVKEILPLKDSLELGLESAQTSEDIASILEGFSLTLKMFVDALGRLEVKELDPLGESFNPEEHQAMTTEYVEGKPSGIVVKVFQKGYLLHERLVRPALVVVSTDKANNLSQ